MSSSPPHPTPPLKPRPREASCCVASSMCASPREASCCVASTMCASSKNVIIPTPPHPTPETARRAVRNTQKDAFRCSRKILCARGYVMSEEQQQQQQQCKKNKNSPLSRVLSGLPLNFNRRFDCLETQSKEKNVTVQSQIHHHNFLATNLKALLYPLDWPFPIQQRWHPMASQTCRFCEGLVLHVLLGRNGLP